MVTRVLAALIPKGIASLTKAQKASKLYKKLEGKYFKKSDLFPYHDKKGYLRYRLTNPNPSERMMWSNRRDPITGKKIKVPVSQMKKYITDDGQIRFMDKTGEKAKAAEVKGIISALHSKY